jgi:uncharacterized membrane protein YbhN (UPF0104 family)
MVKTNWAFLKNYHLNINWKFLFGAFCFLTGNYLFQSYIWHLILKFSGISVSLFISIRSWIYSIIGKYIPGRIFYVVGRIHFSSKSEYTKEIASLTFLEVCISFVACGFLFLISFPLIETAFFKVYIYATIIGVFFILILIHPKILFKIINIILKIMGLTPLSISITYGKILLLLLFQVFNFGFLGTAGFYCFINAFYPVPLDRVFLTSAILFFTSLISLIVVFVPAGIGVRESIFIILLMKILPQTETIVISIGTRLWSVSVESFLIALTLFIFESGLLKPIKRDV